MFGSLPETVIGKGFIEYNTRQTAHDIYSVGKQLFDECFFIAHLANGLPSVKFDTRQKKWFAECFFKIHSAKDYCLTSVFGNYTRQTCFPKKKKFSAYHYCLPSVFGNYTRQTYFPKKKNNFFLSIFQFNSCHTKHS